MERMTDHCPACRIHRELTEHRDKHAADWSIRRGAFNFALVLAERACPDPHAEHAAEAPETGAERQESA